MQLLVTRLFCNALSKMIARSGVDTKEYEKLLFVDNHGHYYQMKEIKFDLPLLYERGAHPKSDEALRTGSFSIKLEQTHPVEAGKSIWVDPMLRSIGPHYPGEKMHIESVDAPVYFLEANGLFGVEIGDEVVMTGNWGVAEIKTGKVVKFREDAIHVEDEEGEIWLMNNADMPMWRILDFRDPQKRTLNYRAGDVVDVIVGHEVIRGLEICRVNITHHTNGLDTMVYQAKKLGGRSVWVAQDAEWDKTRYILGLSRYDNQADDEPAKYKVGDRVYFEGYGGETVTGTVISNNAADNPRYRVESDLGDIWHLEGEPNRFELYIGGREVEIREEEEVVTKFAVVTDEDLSIEIGKIFNVMHFSIEDGKINNVKSEKVAFTTNTAQRLTSLIEETLYARVW